MAESSKSSKLQRRALSAFILAPAILWVIFKGDWPFFFLILVCGMISLFEWYKLSILSKYKILLLVLGTAYVSFSYGACYLLREAHSASIALFFIVLVWASDSGAYFVGKTVGGPKLAKEISPNKTWAGFGGAIFFPALIALTYTLYLGKDDEFSIIFSVFAGGLMGVVGQFGDLLISGLKRHVGVKDTGDIIPGHGGLLDRVDAMMLAAPVFLLIVTKFSDVFTN